MEYARGCEVVVVSRGVTGAVRELRECRPVRLYVHAYECRSARVSVHVI